MMKSHVCNRFSTSYSFFVSIPMFYRMQQLRLLKSNLNVVVWCTEGVKSKFLQNILWGGDNKSHRK